MRILFFSRGPSEFPITARIRRLALPTYRPRGEGLSVCGCNCGSTGHGRGRHGPATSTCDLHSRSVGRPHQAAPACAPQQQVQPNRSTAQPQFRHRPTTQGQLRHCGPPWLHGGTIPAPNPVCSASARAMCQSKRQAKAASNSAAGVQWPQCHVLVPGTGQAGSTSTCTAMARLHEPVPAMIMTRDPAG